jgi:hypothetical protein
MSVMYAFTSGKFSCNHSKFSFVPFRDRLSSTWISHPLLAKCTALFTPMKPAPVSVQTEWFILRQSEAWETK